MCDGEANIQGYLDCTTSFPSGTHEILAIVQDADGHQSSSVLNLTSVNRESYDADLDGYSPKEGDCDDDNNNTYDQNFTHFN